MAQFEFQDLYQLARAATEGRAAANMLAKQWGAQDGIVQCIRAAASLLETTYRDNASQTIQIEVASRLRTAQDAAENAGRGSEQTRPL